MDSQSYDHLKAIWNQHKAPVILRPGGKEKLKARFPYHNLNRFWIKEGHRIEPQWDIEKKYWTLPKSWFNDIIDKCLEKYGEVYVIQPYREQEKCAPVCMKAKGHICNCSCMGANHGKEGPNSDWLVISDAFATRWGEKEYACRLLKNSDFGRPIEP